MRAKILIMALPLLASLQLQAQQADINTENEVAADTVKVDVVDEGFYFNRFNIINQLASPTAQGGAVVVTLNDEAQSIINGLNSQSKPDYIRGYRVGLYFDNGQDARANAEFVKRKFKNLYPHIKVYVNYENPYFKVAAGDCISQEEAVMLLEEVRPSFPKAFIQRDDIPIKDL